MKNEKTKVKGERLSLGWWLCEIVVLLWDIIEGHQSCLTSAPLQT